MKKIAIFASGNGSNAENLINYFKNSSLAKVELILTNNPKAFVIQRAKKHGIPIIIFNRDEFYKTDKILNLLLEKQIDLVVLAGFLWLVPSKFIKNFPKKIINIHPSLLPKYGGKGMYGDFVHKKVLENKEKYSGITIHYVNEKYDDGEVILQEKVKIDDNETIESLAKKIHKLEYNFLPLAIEKILKQKI